jgi:predicted DNA-binding transcriptional regulator YafY
LEGTVLYDSLQALFEKVWPRNKKLKDGSLELTFEVAGIKEIKTWIFGFGSLAEVLEPAPLVKESQRRLGEVTESLRRGKTSKDR